MRGLLVVVVLLVTAGGAHAHGLRSVYIELDEVEPGRARILVRSNVPVTGIELAPERPCSIDTTETGRWLTCPRTLVGATLTVRGMGTIISDAVIYVSRRDGTAISASVTARQPAWTIPDPAGAGTLATARRYVELGVLHIATGFDHLLFLLALVLCLRKLRAVLLAETAFTLSHTLSFSATALGWVHVSAAAAEACIAASLVLVALDAGRPLRDTPWKTAGLAFAFGLVHGLGFAGGLAEIGLPASAVPAALIGFATGVELGQIAFLALAVAALAWIARRSRLDAIAVRLGACAVGSIGCFWLFQRITALG